MARRQVINPLKGSKRDWEGSRSSKAHCTSKNGVIRVWKRCTRCHGDFLEPHILQTEMTCEILHVWWHSDSAFGRIPALLTVYICWRNQMWNDRPLWTYLVFMFAQGCRELAQGRGGWSDMWHLITFLCITQGSSSYSVVLMSWHIMWVSEFHWNRRGTTGFLSDRYDCVSAN